MAPAIALRLRQHLTLTPQVQQALRLLQMSALEFAQEMDEALGANPFLEENPDAPQTTQREGTAVEEMVIATEPPAGPPPEREQEDWGGADVEPTLREHLREQLMLSQMSERDRALAHMIIDSLDEDGYFKTSFDELAALELLANREWARLQHAAGCDEAELHEARALIRSLDPRPGHRFGSTEARYVVPDVIVKKVRDKWMALINPASLPRVRLNRSYAEAASYRGNGVNPSLTRHLQEARWLLRSIEQRFATIQRVADAIVGRQRSFFEYGEVAMKPLTLKLIAGELGLHESTVCRVTNGKYMATPRGLLEFKHFFSRRLATEHGGAASATAVRAVIKELIAAEDPQAPLSDAELARVLAQQGLRVARRTITKYRALMRMPSVDVRRADTRRETQMTQRRETQMRREAQLQKRSP